ncbi:hypothetical protein [Metamycoplasma cloacale]|nr:hypothetical protein [Metamycoplasma cloacale]
MNFESYDIEHPVALSCFSNQKQNSDFLLYENNQLIIKMNN